MLKGKTGHRRMTLRRKTYKWFYDHIHSRYYNFLTQWCLLPFGGETRVREALIVPVDFSPNEIILDMCCGTGGATRFIAKKADEGSQIVGIDISHGQIRQGRKRLDLGRVQLLVSDAGCTAFRSLSFDKVFMTHALHEMPREIRQQVLAEARRILKDKGKIIILELDNPAHPLVRLFVGFWFFYWLPFNFETPTRRDMLKQGLTKEVKQAGFKQITKTSKCSGIFQTVQGTK
jgi:ubiquinone/menaquinone biosynthesis C-methylase UbiE